MTGTRSLLVGLWLGTAGVLTMAGHASASPLLIEEAEKLRKNLPKKDKEQRRMFTIRLANLYFTEAVNLAADKPDDVKAQKTVEGYRRRSLALYNEYLSGNDGEYDKPDGEPKAASQFQVAKLYTDLGQADKAEKLWRQLVKETDYPKIAAEAALSLAEIEEAKNPASKTALDLYEQALVGEPKHDTRIYVHYRRAWILRNLDRYPEAITALKEAMFDAQGQLKDEVLSDLIVFHAASSLDVEDIVTYFESLQERVQDNNLIKRLADAYLAAGKKDAAVAVLVEANNKSPDLLTAVKLLEESYGLRKWNVFEDTLSSLKNPSLKGMEDKGQKKTNAILKRLIVQLDSERKTAPETLSHFVGATQLFLKLYPADETSYKMVGSLAGASSEPKEQIATLQEALANPAYKFTSEQRLSFNEQLIALHQKVGDHAAAASEAKAMAAVTTKPEDRRRFAFIQASELYDDGKKEEALPHFLALAKANGLDDIGRKSMMLVVRSKGQDKHYKEALDLATPWLAAADKNADAQKSTEYKAIVEVKESSEFEWATSLGDTPEALAIFRRYCDKGQFMPQSCANTKSVAARVKDFDTLIARLKAEKSDDELAIVYEENGFFEEAARHYEEKLLTKADATTTDYLKVALFYEIPGKKAEQRRVLEKLARKLQKGSFASEQEEALILATLKDADMMNASMLALPWAAPLKCQLMDEMAAKGDESLKKQILKCAESSGPAWRDAAMASVSTLASKQEKMQFYGNNSEARFKRRLKAITQMDEAIQSFLKAADTETAALLAAKGHSAFAALSGEIENTPIPKEVPAEQLPEIKEGLAKMAAPFKEKAQAYLELKTKQEALLAQNPPMKTAPQMPVAFSQDSVTAHLKALNRNPEDRVAIKSLVETYKKSEQPRIAAYFEGRLNRLGGEN